MTYSGPAQREQTTTTRSIQSALYMDVFALRALDAAGSERNQPELSTDGALEYQHEWGSLRALNVPRLLIIGATPQ